MAQTNDAHDPRPAGGGATPAIRRPVQDDPADPPKRDTSHSRRKDKDKDTDADDKPAGKSNAGEKASEKSSEKSGATTDSGSSKEKSSQARTALMRSVHSNSQAQRRVPQRVTRSFRALSFRYSKENMAGR